MISEHHHSVFTTPIPLLSKNGVDFISGSGAVAVFVMEAGAPLGLRFNSVYSVGNSAQIGVEDVLAYLDNSFDARCSSRIKLLYIESVNDAQRLLKHARSLIAKGCKIAAIKSGSSDEGSRAALSHTGALANSDVAVDALFKKAGIVRCYGRMELVTVASVFMCSELAGKNLAIITHAGGPAVMLTDVLAKWGFGIPYLSGKKAERLQKKLYDGSSVANPIDFLATGNAEQLGSIIDACEKDFDEVDAMVVVFGSSGLFPVEDVYDVLHKKMQHCTKPIYPVLPSVVNVKDDIDYFISRGNVNFPDEVMFGDVLGKVYNTRKPAAEQQIQVVNSPLRSFVEHCDDGYLPPKQVNELLTLAHIPMVKEIIVTDKEMLEQEVLKIGYPVAMKVVGPNHKSDVGGVVLDVNSNKKLLDEFDRLMQINKATGVLIQPMLSGLELFVGAKYEKGFGHVVLCGIGGIFVEVLNDVSSALVPLSKSEAMAMICNLKAYKIIEGTRGKEGIDVSAFADVLISVSNLLMIIQCRLVSVIS